MKKQIKAITLFSIIWIVSGAFTIAEATNIVPIKLKKPEDLQGHSAPVTVFQDSENLEIDFEEALGVLQIFVSNSSGGMLFWQNRVVESAGINYIIPINEWSEGEYVLTISYGIYVLEGRFEIIKD